MSTVIDTTPFALSAKDLPFCIEGTWLPPRTNCYETDCATGRDAARKLLTMVDQSDNPNLVTNLARMVVASGTWGGVEIGLFTVMGIAMM